MSLEFRIKSAIRDVPDFPKEGILFKDVTTLLLDPVFPIRYLMLWLSATETCRWMR